MELEEEMWTHTKMGSPLQFAAWCDHFNWPFGLAGPDSIALYFLCCFNCFVLCCSFILSSTWLHPCLLHLCTPLLMCFFSLSPPSVHGDDGVGLCPYQFFPHLQGVPSTHHRRQSAAQFFQSWSSSTGGLEGGKNKNPAGQGYFISFKGNTVVPTVLGGASQCSG